MSNNVDIEALTAYRFYTFTRKLLLASDKDFTYRWLWQVKRRTQHYSASYPNYSSSNDIGSSKRPAVDGKLDWAELEKLIDKRLDDLEKKQAKTEDSNNVAAEASTVAVDDDIAVRTEAVLDTKKMMKEKREPKKADPVDDSQGQTTSTEKLQTLLLQQRVLIPRYASLVGSAKILAELYRI
jgi:hypothetical protein